MFILNAELPGREYKKVLFELTKFRNLFMSWQYVQVFIFYREKSYNVSMFIFYNLIVVSLYFWKIRSRLKKKE